MKVIVEMPVKTKHSSL